MKTSLRIRRLTQASVMAALIFVSVYLIRIPVFSGYIHAGDGLIFITAVMLPLPYAASAAVIGSCAADLLTGSPLWIPATAVIKLCTVLCFPHADFPERLPAFRSRRSRIALGLSALLCAGGYWLWEALFVTGSASAALLGIPFNLLQSALGTVLFFMAGRLIDRYAKRAGNSGPAAGTGE